MDFHSIDEVNELAEALRVVIQLFTKISTYPKLKNLTKIKEEIDNNKEKLIDEEPIRITMNGNKKKISCDLHELFLDEAKSVIWDTIEECIQNKIEELEIIHGYKHGQVLKNYFRSKYFIHDFSSPKFIIQFSNTSDPGITIIKIKHNSFDII